VNLVRRDIFLELKKLVGKINMALIVHIKCLRSNFFIIISNTAGNILFSKSSGNLGFTHTKKRTKDAFTDLLALACQYLLQIGSKMKVFLKIEGAIKNIFFKQIDFQLLKLLKLHNINVLGLKLINKISHNGCRKSIRRK
jgi:ribosomal protein S11